MKRTNLLLTLLVSLLFAGATFAQGVTTAAISGKITDSKGASLPGATIVRSEEHTSELQSH